MALFSSGGFAQLRVFLAFVALRRLDPAQTRGEEEGTPMHPKTYLIARHPNRAAADFVLASNIQTS
ncbi:hypothetical protein [Chelativorans intermedius]|uniref:Uncharacterized protein n=1 Tax=Chelativorans intermedius TaxID=515947 RepID=A0ABV6D9N3_9HYPH|nr:hypothetical protein [Chelativorans intermedius]MCT8998546.1 hypothetical protein [Chelativorans intermedius]